jgi:ABC-type branched-subunit amino acid transport system ATPase component
MSCKKKLKVVKIERPYLFKRIKSFLNKIKGTIELENIKIKIEIKANTTKPGITRTFTIIYYFNQLK